METESDALPAVTEPVAASEQQKTIAVIPEEGTPEQSGQRRQLIKSATLVSLGNLGSSLLGLVRQSAVASLGKGIAGPFIASITPQQTFLDLLANGTVSGALIPTFADYAEGENKQELRRIVYSIVNLLLVVMVVVATLFTFVAPWFIGNVLTGDFKPAEKALTIQFSQVVIFSLIIMGPFAVLQAALYSRKDFGWPAFASGALHIGIIIGAIITTYFGATTFGRVGLAVGMILGACCQIGLLLPGLRRQGLSYMMVMDLKHPAIRRIIKLYAPLAASYLVSAFFVFLDQTLASHTPGDPAANWTGMKMATTLVQFPQGLVSTALSFAILPTLSQMATSGDDSRFKETLLMGIRLGLLLMIPAAVGLIILQHPITSLIFEHRHYTAQDAGLAALALQNYAYQLPFQVVDQLVMFAFYARKNTIVPVIVGFISYGLYAVVALPTFRTIGMPALAFANTVQISMHGIILLALFLRFFGSLNMRKTLPAILKISIASAAMGLVAWGLLQAMSGFAIFSLHTLVGQILTVVIAGGAALVVYLGGILVFKVEEIGMLKGAVMAKLGRK